MDTSSTSELISYNKTKLIVDLLVRIWTDLMACISTIMGVMVLAPMFMLLLAGIIAMIVYSCANCTDCADSPLTIVVLFIRRVCELLQIYKIKKTRYTNTNTDSDLDSNYDSTTQLPTT